MDILEISTAMSQINLMQQVNVSLLSNQMELEEVVGEGITEMIDAAAMERSVNPSVGSNFDMCV